VQPLPGAADPIAAKIPPPNIEKCAYFAQKRIDKSAPECYYCTAKQNTEWYRRGHNGMDSKFFEELAVCSAKKARKIRGFLRFEN